MSPRERFAWVWLAATVVIFGVYFTALSILQQSTPDIAFTTQIGLLATALLSLALVVGVDRIVAAVRHSGKTPMDERDRFIELRSSSIAYYVLMGGMILVGCVMPFSSSAWDIVHAALFMILLAEGVHAGLVVLGYRRGWHA